MKIGAGMTKTKTSACHSRENGNPEKHWIPPYQARGRLSQARNDKLDKTYVVMHKNRNYPLP